MTSFVERYTTRVEAVNSLLCVGLDSDLRRLPESVRASKTPQLDFNRAIIEATHDLVVAYKPNAAFYEARGDQGLRELNATMEYLHEHHPDILTIYDAKRADIGSTNEGYVTAIFDELGFDAVTLHPYLGREALQPFLDRADKGCIILARTSNPGAGEFQDLILDGQPLWEHVAQAVVETWNEQDNCLLVVGATYPEEMKRIRELAPGLTFLVPGIGAQGGNVEEAVTAGLDQHGRGMIINSSRDLIFASSGPDFAETARARAQALRDEINRYRR